MKNAHITEIKGIRRGAWVWCLHCERVYRAGEYREDRGLQYCHYPDCDGDTVMDSWEWESIRQAHPEYPEIPERNKVYPLY
jgi:hypothetical protein